MTDDAPADPPPLPDHRCLPAFDLEPRDWLVPPSRSILICASPRTGSTWVCEELGFRGLGEPLEYLNPVYVHYLSWRWQCTNLAQYRMMLWRTRTSPSGVFAMKILGMHMFSLTDDTFAPLLGGTVDGSDGVASARHRRRQVEAVAPSPTYVWLRRHDKAEQAVSWWIAEQTGLWMQKLSRDSRALESLTYDFEGIDRLRQQAESDDSAWASFFATNAITPVRIDYEDCLADPSGRIGALAQELGGTFAPTGDVPELRNHPQRNSLTNEFAERYRRDRYSSGAHIPGL